MGEFFQGWRRKIGCITLLMACVAMGGWVRGLSVADCARIRTGPCSLDHFVSSKFGLVWDRRMVADSNELIRVSNLQRYSVWHPKSNKRNVSTFKTYDSIFDVVAPFDIDWDYQLCGVHFGQGVPKQASFIRNSFVFISYWSIIIPLTLASAFLLSKPRKSTQMKTDEPIAAEGT